MYTNNNFCLKCIQRLGNTAIYIHYTQQEDARNNKSDSPFKSDTCIIVIMAERTHTHMY